MFIQEGVRSLRAQVSERVTLLRMDVTHAGDVTAVCQQVKDALKEGQHQGQSDVTVMSDILKIISLL